MIAIICYLCMSVFVGLITYTVSDPYGHNSNKQPWYTIKEVLFFSLLWPFILVYVICMWFYYTYIRKGS